MFTRSRCGQMAKLDVIEPHINTHPYLSQHLKGLHVKVRFWLEERSRVRGYGTVPGGDEPHRWPESMMAFKSTCETTHNVWIYEVSQECMRNHTNCVDPSKLNKCAWAQELGIIQCLFLIMRWCLSTLQSSPIYILAGAELISISPESPFDPPLSPLSLYLCMPPLASSCETEQRWWSGMEFPT